MNSLIIHSGLTGEVTVETSLGVNHKLNEF